MKTKVFSLVIFLFLLTVISGCRKDEVDVGNPPIIPPVSTLNVSVNPLTVDYRGQVTIIWTSLNLNSLRVNDKIMSDLTIYLNGVKQPTIADGFLVLNELTKDTIVKFTGLGKDGKVYNLDYKITVAPKPAPTRTDTLCYDLSGRYWKMVEFRTFHNGITSIFPPSETEKFLNFHFYSNGQSKVIDSRTGNLFMPGNWAWIGTKDSIRIGSQRLGYLLNDSIFVRYNSYESGAKSSTTYRSYFE